MNSALAIDRIVSIANPSGAWTYWSPGIEDIVELALVHGTEVALPDHFHDEDQITFVLTGRRRFVIGGKVVIVEAGEGICIPSGLPHRSLPQPHGVTCLNIYTHARTLDVAALLTRLKDDWRNEENFSPALLFHALPEHRASSVESTLSLPSDFMTPVHLAATNIGMSREGYSRAFRRAHGMPPKTFAMTSRLNDARKLLRAGTPLVDTAVMSGFADQSHLGRCFRRAFGVTPGRYRTR
ncbi:MULTISPECIES: helix-turn-helix transcriptional regulator [unclassified Dyella]|uniref:AraC family transcriptional regulator n=1 Tax=unclassified Dyella TaxID=2634549 RepID=UPI000CA804D5|nr:MULTISPECIES: helix-turn-helix transcriptional regulator [unclassified Dyella]MDR3443797.1 helix-turn-helix transcriptional regulator [Dyella sp.]PMQ03308.1 HTH-type transcriptional regulator ChbR [Dyella sp. AD56]